MRGILIILTFFLSLTVQSQVSLENCIQSALNSHPSLKSRQSFGLINQQELENNKILKYPSLQVSGQGKYQSDVVTFDIEGPFGELDFPEIPHFQYNLSINANQVLYDGGRKMLERDLLQVEYKKQLAGLDAREREVEESVQKLYIEVLLKEKQIGVLELLQNSLDTGISSMQAGVKGGVVSEMDLEIMKAEKIDLNRKLLSLEKSRISIIQQLSLLCNIEIDPSEIFQIPEVNFALLEPLRAEYDIFDYQQRSLDIRKSMAGLKRAPKVAAFGQAGYGRPGLNFMSDQWQDFYILGLQFSWIPWDYKELKRKRAIIDINSQMIGFEKEAFDLQLQSAVDIILNRINLNEEIIVEDEKMVVLRESIRIGMEKKMKEGVVTSSQYITELNREQQARLELEKSKLELLANQLAYQIIIGK